MAQPAGERKGILKILDDKIPREAALKRLTGRFKTDQAKIDANYARWDDAYQERITARGLAGAAEEKEAQAIYHEIFGKPGEVRADLKADVGSMEQGLAKEARDFGTELRITLSTTNLQQLGTHLQSLVGEIGTHYKKQNLTGQQIAKDFGITALPQGWGEAGSKIIFNERSGILEFKTKDDKTVLVKVPGEGLGYAQGDLGEGHLDTDRKEKPAPEMGEAAKEQPKTEEYTMQLDETALKDPHVAFMEIAWLKYGKVGAEFAATLESAVGGAQKLDRGKLTVQLPTEIEFKGEKVKIKAEAVPAAPEEPLAPEATEAKGEVTNFTLAIGDHYGTLTKPMYAAVLGPDNKPTGQVLSVPTGTTMIVLAGDNPTSRELVFGNGNLYKVSTAPASQPQEAVKWTRANSNVGFSIPKSNSVPTVLTYTQQSLNVPAINALRDAGFFPIAHEDEVPAEAKRPVPRLGPTSAPLDVILPPPTEPKATSVPPPNSVSAG